MKTLIAADMTDKEQNKGSEESSPEEETAPGEGSTAETQTGEDEKNLILIPDNKGLSCLDYAIDNTHEYVEESS